MKKILCACCCLLLAVFSVSGARILNARQEAMGGIRVAVCSSDIPFFDNPAAVYFYKKKHNFFLSAGISDPVLQGIPRGLQNTIMAQFMSRNLALGITAGLESTNVRDYQGYALTDLSKEFILDADIAFGYSFFGAGLTVSGGASWMRYDSVLSGGTEFADYLKESILGSFTRQNSSQYLELGGGAIFDFLNVKFGVLCDNIFSYESNTMNFTVTGQNLLNNLGAGVYYQMDSFSAHGRFKPFVFSLGLEAQNIGLNDRTVNLGAEARFQITRTDSISLRGGLDMILARFQNSMSTYGFGVRFGKCDISASAVVPFEMYRGSANDDFVISVSFGFVV